MTIFEIAIAALAGYVVSIFTWPWVRTVVAGGKTEIASLEARAKALRAKL